MNENIARISKNFSLICLSLSLILTPIFFLPLTTDFFGFNKLGLWLLLTALSLIGWLIYNLATKTVRLTLSPMLLPLVIFSGVVAVSVYLNNSQNPDAWLNRTAFYLTMPIFYLIFTTLIQTSNQVRVIVNWIIGGSVLLSLLGILSVLGVFANSSLPAFLTVKNFSPAGSLLNLVILLFITLPLSLVLAFKTRLGPKKMQYFLSSGLIMSALILVGFQLLPKREFAAILLPKVAGWSIAIDTFKSSVLFGAGPGNFLTQFTRFRPVSLNLTDLWNVAFTTSANEYLHLMTTLGIGGLLAFALILFSWRQLVKRDPGTRTTSIQMALNWAIIVTLVLGFIVPFSIVTWIMILGFLSLTVGLNKNKNVTKVKDVILTINAVSLLEPFTPSPVPHQGISSGILPWLLTIPAVLGITLAALGFGRVYAADVVFRNSLVAANQNLGLETYNRQIKAIALSPSLDRYRISYSNTNLALANALSQESNLTDQDRQTVATLIQQAIAEGRTATQLNPNKSANWANLANIYRQLINFADGADNFAAAAYIRAIQLDPSNARLRVELGGLYYSLNQYPEAIDRFREATQLKSNFANAYYNLSYAYQQQEQWLSAYQAMQQVVAVLPANSDDALKARQELDALEAKLPQKSAEEKTPAQSNELEIPASPPPAPADFPLIELDSTETTPSSQNSPTDN
jgi:tetratricopeptide (TPR) repeat protein